MPFLVPVPIPAHLLGTRPLTAFLRRGVAAGLPAVIAAGFAACATVSSAGPTPLEDRPEATRTESLRATQGQGLVAFHPTPNRARIIEFAASPDSLWPRVIQAYDRLGLPLGEVDARARTLGTSSVRTIGRIGDVRVGEYVDCGSGPLGARLADTYVVTLRAVTELKALGDTTAPSRPAASGPGARQTVVRTLVTATAKPNSTQGDPVDCISTGRLETRLVRLIDPAAPQPTAGAPRG